MADTYYLDVDRSSAQLFRDSKPAGVTEEMNKSREFDSVVRFGLQHLELNLGWIVPLLYQLKKDRRNVQKSVKLTRRSDEKTIELIGYNPDEIKDLISRFLR